jgi:hypothetical protein
LPSSGAILSSFLIDNLVYFFKKFLSTFWYSYYSKTNPEHCLKQAW